MLAPGLQAISPVTYAVGFMVRSRAICACLCIGECQYLGCCSAPFSVGVYALVSGRAAFSTDLFVGIRLIGLMLCDRAGT